MSTSYNYLSFFRNALNFTSADRQMLTLLFAPHITPQSLADVFVQVDVDALHLERISLLSQLCIKANYQGVPFDQHPRMRGISRYFVTFNARQALSLLKFARLYAQAGIDMLLCKGIAMRLAYMAGQSRHMWDVDIVVRPEDYASALDIARCNGYVCKAGVHASTLEKDRFFAIDLHAYFHKTSVKGVDESGVWARSQPLTIHGHKFLLPCAEDMLVQLLSNEFSNIIIEGDTRPHLKWVYDVGWIIRSNSLDWQLVFKISKELRLAHIIKIMLLLLEDTVPGLVNMRALDCAFPGYENNSPMLAHYCRSTFWFKRYFNAKRSKKISRYMWLWPIFAWHYHCYYRYGTPLVKRILLFPHYLKTVFNANSWWDFPLAGIKTISARMRQDKGLSR